MELMFECTFFRRILNKILKDGEKINLLAKQFLKEDLRFYFIKNTVYLKQIAIINIIIV